MMTTEQLIEAILFFKGEPVLVNRLQEILNKSEEEITNALKELEQSLSLRGIVLMRKEDEVMLATNKSAGYLIEKLIKEELHKDLGRAGLETLSIILYLGPISRSEIDYIRGVNSNFILRNLLIRGLVERIDKPHDKRSFFYQGTFDLLSYLGVSKVEELTDYEVLKTELILRKKAREEVDQKEIEMNKEL